MPVSCLYFPIICHPPYHWFLWYGWMIWMDVSRDKESLDRSVRRWIIISSLSHTSALPNMITLSSANWNRQKCSNQKREIFFFDMNKKKRTTRGGLFDDDVAMRMVCCAVCLLLFCKIWRGRQKRRREISDQDYLTTTVCTVCLIVVIIASFKDWFYLWYRRLQCSFVIDDAHLIPYDGGVDKRMKSADSNLTHYLL